MGLGALGPETPSPLEIICPIKQNLFWDTIRHFAGRVPPRAAACDGFLFVWFREVCRCKCVSSQKLWVPRVGGNSNQIECTVCLRLALNLPRSAKNLLRICQDLPEIVRNKMRAYNTPHRNHRPMPRSARNQRGGGDCRMALFNESAPCPLAHQCVLGQGWFSRMCREVWYLCRFSSVILPNR